MNMKYLVLLGFAFLMSSLHSSDLVERPGQRSVYDASFSDGDGSLGECWGDLNHSIVEIGSKGVIGDLPQQVERFNKLRKTLCSGNDENSLEKYEFECKSKVAINYLSDLLDVAMEKSLVDLSKSLQEAIESLQKS